MFRFCGVFVLLVCGVLYFPKQSRFRTSARLQGAAGPRALRGLPTMLMRGGGVVGDGGICGFVVCGVFCGVSVVCLWYVCGVSVMSQRLQRSRWWAQAGAHFGRSGLDGIEYLWGIIGQLSGFHSEHTQMWCSVAVRRVSVVDPEALFKHFM